MTQVQRQFLLYLVCGGLGVDTDFACYLLLSGVGLHYQAANITG
jgi:putative flippase GtrA